VDLKCAATYGRFHEIRQKWPRVCMPIVIFNTVSCVTYSPHSSFLFCVILNRFSVFLVLIALIFCTLQTLKQWEIVREKATEN
jgi:hypothetical protein